MDWILLIVPGVIWGASFLFIAEGLEVMGPNGVTFTRILVGFLTLALVRGETVAALSVAGGVVCLAGAWLMRRAQLEHAVRAPAPTAPVQLAKISG